MAPPGRQKSECAFCLFGGVLFVRRAAPYGRLAVLARPAAVMRAFVPGACFSVLHCSRGFSPLFFTLPCLTSSSQTSFHLSLMPRRGFPRLSPPAALFPACMSCRLLLFRGLLRPLPVCLFCVVYASSLLFFCPFLPNFFLSNLFSFVAQAATGLYFLPKRK